MGNGYEQNRQQLRLKVLIEIAKIIVVGGKQLIVSKKEMK